MKKIVFGITNLSVGGAERVLVDIVNELSKNNEYDITIFTLYSKGEFENQLSKSIHIQSLYDNSYNQMSKISKIIVSLRLLLFKRTIYNKYIKNKYNTEIAFLEGPITRLFALNSKANKIAWIHTDITKIFGNNIKSYVKKIYDKKIYSKYKKIVFVSRGNLEQFKKAYPFIKQERLQIVHNYINKENVQQKSKMQIDTGFKKDIFNLVTVARLMKEKGIARLLRTHKKLIEDGLNHNMYVVGNGPEKANLEKMVEKMNLHETFKLLGEKENPYPYIKEADAFCLCSYYEGYPMTIIEAKILEKFIFITDTSAKEAVENYSKSMIVKNDEEHIYRGLKELLENKEKYLNANLEIKYDNNDVIKQVKELLN